MPPSAESVQVYEDVKKAHSHNHPGGDVVSMAILNWVAPATLKSETQRGHADLLRVIANEGQDNVAIVMMQMTTTRKNKLWLQEYNSAKLLSDNRVELDSTLVLPFAVHKHAQDERSLPYNCRIIRNEANKLHKGLWNKKNQVVCRKQMQWSNAFDHTANGCSGKPQRRHVAFESHVGFIGRRYHD